jgi:small subunit ribosomal protein S9
MTKEKETEEEIVVTQEMLEATEEVVFTEVTSGKERITLEKGVYLSTIGRRKTATAKVRLFEGEKTNITVNSVPLEEYFKTQALQKVVKQPLFKLKYPGEFTFSVMVSGSGISSQAQAVRHGIARALSVYDPEVRVHLKRLGYLKRDPRAKERRKAGLAKARKAKQWSKR